MIETSRTFLRQLGLTDAPGVLSIFSNERSMEFAPMPPTQDKSVAESFIRWQIDNYRQHGCGAWAVILKETELFIGQAGLIPHEVGLEVFYSLLPQYWNCGIATELASSCRDYAFEQLGASLVISIIHPKNERAIRVAQKIGMKQNGMIRLWNRDNCLFELRPPAVK